MSEYAAPLPLLARYAVMVDVGYIFAAAGELLLGTSSRRDFRVDAVPAHRRDQQARGRARPRRAAAGLLVRRGPGPGTHHRSAGDRPAAADQTAARQPQRPRPAEGRGRADPRGHGGPGPAPRDHRRGPRRRRRGHGARRGGRAGLRRAGAPVGHRASLRHQPGRTAGLGVRHGGDPGQRVRPALLHPAAGQRGGDRPPGRAAGQHRALPRAALRRAGAPAVRQIGPPPGPGHSAAGHRAGGPGARRVRPGRPAARTPRARPPRPGSARTVCGSRRPASTWPRSGS